MTPKSYIRCKDCRFLLWKGESCFRPLELAIESEFKQVPCNITLIKQSLLPDLKKPLIKSNYRFWNWFSFELGRETSLTFFFTKILRHLETIFTIPNFPPHYYNQNQLQKEKAIISILNRSKIITEENDIYN